MEVCRVCLAMDVRMHHMTQKLTAMFARVINIKVKVEDKMPQQLCWECLARLRSANKFIEKALKTQNILMDKLKDCSPMQIHNKITSIDRVKHRLCSTLLSKINNYNKYSLPSIGRDQTDSSHENFEEINAVESNDLEDVTDLNINVQVSNINVDEEGDNITNYIEMENANTNRNAFEIEVKIENLCEELPVDRMILDVNMENGEKSEDMSSRRNGSCTPLRKQKLSDLLASCKDLRVVLERINFNKNTIQVNTNNVSSSKMVLRKRNNHISYWNVKKNRRVKHRDPVLKNIFICDICDKQHNRKTSLKLHMQKHTSSQIFHCAHCTYKSDQKGNLKSHVNTMHTKSTIFKCPYCPYKTFQKGYVKKHVNQKHTRAISYNCPHCPYISYNTSVLKCHINAIHTKQTVYKCTYCAYESFAKFRLKQHINAKHFKTKSYNCSLCTYRTYNKYDVRRHINGKHTKKTIFKCSLCRFTSFYENSLFKHMKVRHSSMA